MNVIFVSGGHCCLLTMFRLQTTQTYMYTCNVHARSCATQHNTTTLQCRHGTAQHNPTQSSQGQHTGCRLSNPRNTCKGITHAVVLYYTSDMTHVIWQMSALTGERRTLERAWPSAIHHKSANQPSRAVCSPTTAEQVQPMLSTTHARTLDHCDGHQPNRH